MATTFATLCFYFGFPLPGQDQGGDEAVVVDPPLEDGPRWLELEMVSVDDGHRTSSLRPPETMGEVHGVDIHILVQALALEHRRLLLGEHGLG